jgi:hypothetical protein
MLQLTKDFICTPQAKAPIAWVLATPLPVYINRGNAISYSNLQEKEQKMVPMLHPQSMKKLSTVYLFCRIEYSVQYVS